MWDADTSEEVATIKGHTAGMTDVAWSPDGSGVATAAGDGTLKVWQAG